MGEMCSYNQKACHVEVHQGGNIFRCPHTEKVCLFRALLATGILIGQHTGSCPLGSEQDMGMDSRFHGDEGTD